MGEVANNPKTAAGMYMLYLDKMGLREEDMPEVQRQETERAFYGGLAAFHVFVIGQTEEVNEMEMKSFMGEIEKYWEAEG